MSFSGYSAGGTHGDIGTGGSTGAGPNFPDLVVPANGSAQFTLTGTVSMDNTSDNACQGATFTIPVSFTGNSGD